MSRRHARLVLDDGRRVFVELDAGAAWVLDSAPWLGGARTGEAILEVDEQARAASGSSKVVRRLAPVTPSKILCVGRNYRAHAAELGNPVPSEPLMFYKPPSALLDPDGIIELPALSKRVEHEVELGVVIGRSTRNVDEATAADAVAGYTIVGDITARDLQRSDKLWTRGKGFDTFCPVGPVVVSGIDASALDIHCTVAGDERQSGNTRDMIFTPAAVIAYISRVMTLEPGDLIATGTPAGVGPLLDGDHVRFAIEGIGELEATARRRE